MSPAAKMSTVTSAPAAGASPARANSCTIQGAASRPAFWAWPNSALVVRVGRLAPKPSCTASGFTWSTLHGPASITVTGTALPSSAKTRVMPSFRPMSPLVIALLDLDLDVHTGREIELGERVHRLRTRIGDVEQALVRAQLELLAALLVDVRAAEHRPPLGLHREGDRARHAGTRLHRRTHDVRRGLVEHHVVERLEADADSLGHSFLGQRSLGTCLVQVKGSGTGPRGQFPAAPGMRLTSGSWSRRRRPPCGHPRGWRTAGPGPSRSA